MHLNERADDLIDRTLCDADGLRVAVTECRGARIVDCGIDAPGGYGAGLMMARTCLADLAEVTLDMGEVAGRPCPHVLVHTDHPVAAGDEIAFFPPITGG